MTKKGRGMAHSRFVIPDTSIGQGLDQKRCQGKKVLDVWDMLGGVREGDQLVSGQVCRAPRSRGCGAGANREMMHDDSI